MNQISPMAALKSFENGNRMPHKVQNAAANMQEGTAYLESWPPILLPMTPLRTAPRIGAVMLVVVKYRVTSFCGTSSTTTK